MLFRTHWVGSPHTPPDRRAEGLRRELRPRPVSDGLLDLAGNDYLGLSTDPRVIEGGVAAARA